MSYYSNGKLDTATGGGDTIHSCFEYERKENEQTATEHKTTRKCVICVHTRERMGYVCLRSDGDARALVRTTMTPSSGTPGDLDGFALVWS